MTATEPARPGGREAHARQRTATLSVAAAVFLVAIKLATGLATGSLAFLAEAVHSGTDLVAALLTLFAVRVAVRPPDREHHYGHGKAEHLAALGESAFLLLVSLFIAFESLRRLIDGGSGHDIEVTWWALTRARRRDRGGRLARARELPGVAPLRLRGARRQRAPLHAPTSPARWPC